MIEAYEPSGDKVLALEKDPNLDMLLQSFVSYFFEHKLRSRGPLNLKFKELIIQMITGEAHREVRK